MSQVQSGILPEHCRAAIWIEANLKGDVNALREASKIFVDNVATFQAKFPDAKLGAVVAFGNNVWRQLSGGEGAEELKDFIPYGKGLAPATQYDVLIHILSLRHDVNFSVAQAAVAAFGDSIEVQEEVHGFRWVEERDLSGFGSMLFMGLIGIVLASLVNLWLKSEALMWAVTYIGVVLFVGLTAYDTQKLKNIGEQIDTRDSATLRKYSILGALTLYLDFINLFLMLLRIMGNRR